MSETSNSMSTPIRKRDAESLSPVDTAETKKTRTLPEDPTTIQLSDPQLLRLVDLMKGAFESQVTSMVSSIVNGVLGGLQSQVVELQAENKSLHEKVSLLEQRVINLERLEDNASQYSRRTCLRVSGIAEGEQENIDEVVTDLISDLGLDITLGEIDRTHRLGRKVNNPGARKSRPRDIIVKFATYRSRQKLYKKRTALRSSKKYSHVYINEELTRKRGEVYFSARQLVKNKFVSKTWTSDGVIFVEDRHKSVHRCETLSDLDRFKGLY